MNEALVYKSYFFYRTGVLRKLFEIRFSYKHCNFSHICLLVKMASKTVTRSIFYCYEVTVSLLISLPDSVHEIGGPPRYPLRTKCKPYF